MEDMLPSFFLALKIEGVSCYEIRCQLLAHTFITQE